MCQTLFGLKQDNLCLLSDSFFFIFIGNFGKSSQGKVGKKATLNFRH